MADTFSNLIATIQNHIPQVEIILREEWRSPEPDHRHKIRQALETHLASRGEIISARDLTKQPHSERFSISIAHSIPAGGFALVSKEFLIGFDIEDLGRNFEKAVPRVSSPEELSQAPDMAALWVAKEALLKAKRLSLIHEARVETWKTLDPSSCFFSERGNKDGRGIVVKNSRLIMGLFISPS